MTANDELLELIRAERSVSPPASAAERGWARLTLDLAANVAPLPIATGPLKSGLWLVPKWLLAGLALGFVGAGVVVPALTPNAAPMSAHATVIRAAVPAAIAPTLPMTAPPADEHRADTPSPDTRVETALARAVTSPSASAVPTFDAELRLISLAKAELDARHFGLARAELDEHAARFPSGVFATERDALRILISCAQGPKNDALAKKFETQHPGSPLAERLEQACGSASVQLPDPRGSGASVDFSKLPNGAATPGERTAKPSAGEGP